MSVKKNGIKVLIVDDDECVREVMSHILEKRGFITEDAENGKEALRKVTQDKPNIIILDVEMPEMGGLQTCKRLRENPDTQDVPIIFLSAQRCIAEVISNIRGAAIEYIEKPCDIEYLFKQINNLITEQNLLK